MKINFLEKHKSKNIDIYVEINIPHELDRKSALPLLPSGDQSFDQFIFTVNGSVFNCQISNTQSMFDLPSRGNLVGSSVYTKYTDAITQKIAGQIS